MTLQLQHRNQANIATNATAIAVNAAAVATVNAREVLVKDDLGALVSTTRTVLDGRYQINTDIALGNEQLLITGAVEFVGSGELLATTLTAVGAMVLMTAGSSLKLDGVTLRNNGTDTGGIGVISITGSFGVVLDLNNSKLLVGDVAASFGISIAATGAHVINVKGCTISGNKPFIMSASSGAKINMSASTLIARASAGSRCVELDATTTTYATFAHCEMDLGEYTLDIQANTYTSPVRLIGCELTGATTAVFDTGGITQASADVQTLANNGVADG